jgi:hypothetical protein
MDNPKKAIDDPLTWAMLGITHRCRRQLEALLPAAGFFSRQAETDAWAKGVGGRESSIWLTR